MAASAVQLLRTALFELDLLIFVAFAGGALLCNQVLSARQTIREHFLADATLWHEFRGNTVSIEVLFGAAVLVAAPGIFLVEYFVVQGGLQKRAPRRRLLSALRFGLGVLTATAVNLAFVEAGKNYVGFPRPYFARACAGTGAFAHLSGAALTPAGSGARCAGGGGFESRRSFPSGHAALAVGAAFYAQLHLLRAARARPALALASYLPMALALFAAASRVVDNAHHPADVVAGALLGIWPALTHFHYVERAVADAERRDAARAAENGTPARRAD